MAERSKAHDWKSCRVNSPPGFESLPFRHFFDSPLVIYLAAASLLVLAFAPAQYFGRQQDEVLYLVGAQALAAGRYCHLTMPGCPPLVAATPGWPLLLAPFALFTERPGAYQAFAALLAACVPWAAWLWLRRRLEPAPALLGALLSETEAP